MKQPLPLVRQWLWTVARRSDRGRRGLPNPDLRHGRRAPVNPTVAVDKGITGVPDLFEGEHSEFRTYFDGTYDRDAILADLGSEYQGSGTLYKPWPAVGTSHSHSHIHAPSGLMVDHGLTTDDLDEISVYVGDYHDLMCRPLETRRAPHPRSSTRSSASRSWWPSLRRVGP